VDTTITAKTKAKLQGHGDPARIQNGKKSNGIGREYACATKGKKRELPNCRGPLGGKKQHTGARPGDVL